MPKLFGFDSAKLPGLPISDLPESVPEAEVMGFSSPEAAPLTRTAARTKSKQDIRSSLKASTFDGVFSTFFTCVTADVLLSNFLLQLGATSVEIGLLAAMPMLANFLQPVGAYLADRSTSRHWYSLWVFGSARLLWLVLVLGILLYGAHFVSAPQLVQWTLCIVLVTHILGALGSASWVSWMAALVPQRLRGRYFGRRNSAASLTGLLSIPLLGFAVSHWQGGTIQGYSLVLILAVLAGLVSLAFQGLMADVNPQDVAQAQTVTSSSDPAELLPPLAATSLLKDSNFLTYLLHYGLWMFAVNLSAPFFNIYLLRDLGLDVSRVTLYGALTAGANLLMLVTWGKLADRIGNRPILVAVGLLVAVTPLFWLSTGTNSLSLFVWLPLLHLLGGGTWSALDLCSNNLQMAIAPTRQPSRYFAIAAAASGLGGALGTTVGGVLAQFPHLGGLPGLFALSAVLRLVALVPLTFVREPRAQAEPGWLQRLSFKPRLWFENKTPTGEEKLEV